MTAPGSFGPEDYAAIAFAGFPSVSPNGEALAYLVHEPHPSQDTYVTRLTLLDLQTGTSRVLIEENVARDALHWDAESTSVTFLAGDGKSIQRVERDGNPETILTIDDKIVGFALSTDMTMISMIVERTTSTSGVEVYTSVPYKWDGRGFLGNSEREVVIARLQDDGYALHMTGIKSSSLADIACSPDGSTLAFTMPTPEASVLGYAEDIHILPLASAESGIRRVTGGDGRYGSPAFSHTGDQLAFIGTTFSEAFGPATLRSLFVCAVAETGTPEPISYRHDHTVGSRINSDARFGAGDMRPVWSSDDSRIFTIVSRQGDGTLGTYDIHGATWEPITPPGRSVATFSLSLHQNVLVTHESSTSEIGDLWLTQLSPQGPAAERRCLTDINASLMEQRRVTATRKVRVPVSDDTWMDAWLTIPDTGHDGALFPLVVAIHGGPHSLYGEAFQLHFQILAARNVAVLWCNPRGSEGYGQGWEADLLNDWGGIDARDIHTAIDYVLETESVDPNRLGLMGGSYGGYLVNWLISQGNRFRVASSSRSTADRYTHALTSDSGIWKGVWEFGGMPWEQADHFRDRSPLEYADRIETPLLLDHGSDDLRCPPHQSEALFVAMLMAQKTQVEFVRYQGAAHGFASGAKLSHKIDRLQRITEWLLHHLDPDT